MSFHFKKLGLGNVILITPEIFKDNRGFFLEIFKASDFYAAGIQETFTQDNHSFSTKNVLRGIHFQKHPKPQGKIVRCLRGAIFDVAVDLRPSSNTFMKWVGLELTKYNKQMLYIPPGFGHGFSTLSDDAEIGYKCTNEYSSELDGGIIWNDTQLAINWRIKNPLISKKDNNLPTVSQYYNKSCLAEIS